MDSDELRRNLTDLERRIEARSRELAAHGEFDSVHEGYAQGLRQRRAALAQKVDAAVRSGDEWKIVGAELERDFEGIHAEFVQWGEELDAESMRNRNSAT